MQHHPQQMHTGPQNPMLMGGGDSAGSFVEASHLKQADVPVETLLGFANGAFSGALIAGGVSGFLTWASSEKRDFVRNFATNLKGPHLLPVLAFTTALGGFGALVRWSRASKHNEWSDKHYQFMQSRMAPPAPAAQPMMLAPGGIPSTNINTNGANVDPLQTSNVLER